MNEHVWLRERLRELAQAPPAPEPTRRPQRQAAFQDQTGVPIVGIDTAWNTSSWGG